MILDAHGNPIRLAAPAMSDRQAAGTRVMRRLNAQQYDAAETTNDNARHWQHVSTLSADAANNPAIRRTLRNRARYEAANNCYAKGLILTLANDVVGTGPRLQMQTGTPSLDAMTERAFADWCIAIDLAGTLRTLRHARAVDGEVFAALVTNPKTAGPVQLDVQLIEADRIAANPHDYATALDPRDVDGVILDDYGNPRRYRLLKRHPGGANLLPTEAVGYLGASNVIHYFRADRPGQHRGVPDITPALPLIAQLRRFTLAVIAAAETAASFAGVVYTEAVPDGEATTVDPMDTVEFEHRMWTTLPEGWKIGQFKAEQPATTYTAFKAAIINEIARCLNMPYNIAAGNSSGYNYASGRLDHQTYYKAIKVDRQHIETRVLDRIFAAWADEYALDVGPATLRTNRRHSWFWDGQEHVDPAKEANAQATRLINHTTTLAAEYARQGKDWEAELRQRAKEKALMDELGLTAAGPGADEAPDTEDENEDAEKREAQYA